MTADPPITVARPSDAAEIAAMSRSLIEYRLPWSWRPSRVAEALAAPNTNVAVVRDQEGLVAFGIMEYWDDDAHLVLLAVREARQRQGFGCAVLHWLEQSARTAGAQRIRVEARRGSVAARSFYNERGYHERTIKARMYSGITDGVCLEKWLRPSADG